MANQSSARGIATTPPRLTAKTQEAVRGSWVEVSVTAMSRKATTQGGLRTRPRMIAALGGVAAALTQGLLVDGDYPMIGASGAISAVLGGYVLLFPQARIMTFLFFILIGVPAWAYLGYWALLQFYNSLGSFAAGAGVAFFAHLGGFIAGLLSVRSFQPGGPRHY